MDPKDEMVEAYKLEQSGDYINAIRKINEILQNHVTDGERRFLIHYKGDIYNKLNKPRAAVSCFYKAEGFDSSVVTEDEVRRIADDRVKLFREVIETYMKRTGKS